MPYTDVDDALVDMEFIDQLTCTRTTNTVNRDGLNAAVTDSVFAFFGVVTMEAGRQLERAPEGSRVSESISIVTKTQLLAQNIAFQADVVTWNGRDYTVRQVDNYSRYGRGFYQALADLIPLTGGA